MAIKINACKVLRLLIGAILFGSISAFAEEPVSKINDQWRALEPGMVLTIEPGLYIPQDCASVDDRWRGIGIRIEDDVLVTKQGYEILTHAVPKTIADIEAIMQ